MTFEDLDFDEQLLEGLNAMNFVEPTEIQKQAIPLISGNKDLIACAQTGTGKTAAYLLPVINKILASPNEASINTIVIAPTRELAKQIDQQLEGFSYFISVSSLAIYGGSDGETWVREKNALKKGADVIIATPGKMLAHLKQGYCKVDHLKHLILDEADRMLDMGFHDDIMSIISYFPKERQNLLFSATMPPKIRKLAEKILTEPEEINIAISKPAKGIVQAAFLIYDKDKIELIKYLLRDDDVPSLIIFASTKVKVKEITRELKRKEFSVEEIHSDLEQREREDILNLFKGKKLKILVATDIVSRGIDIDSISMVLNYDVPQDAEDYIHRIGRTARASSTGEAITFVNKADQRKLYQIEELIGNEVRKVGLPPHIPEGPAYEPHKKKGGGRRGKKPMLKRRGSR